MKNPIKDINWFYFFAASAVLLMILFPLVGCGVHPEIQAARDRQVQVVPAPTPETNTIRFDERTWER